MSSKHNKLHQRAMSNVAKKLNMAITESDLSRAEIAKRYGCSVQYLYRLEREGTLSLKPIKILCDILEINIKDFFEVYDV